MKLVLTIMLTFSFAFTQASDLKSLMKAFKTELERAHFESTSEELQKLRAKGERLLKMDEYSWHSHYYLAFIYDHLGNLEMGKDEDKADDYFDLALEYLESANERKESEESYAMKSAIYGKKIGLSPIKGMFLGPKSESAIEEAYELNKNNPRVWIVDAIGKMHTPAFFGGDKEKSRELLEKSIEELKTYEEKDSLMIHWGSADAYAWLAELDIKEGKYEDAKKHIDKALEIEKNYGFVIYSTLPKLEAKKED